MADDYEQEWEKASAEVVAVAQRCINDWHPNLKFARIAILMKSTTVKSKSGRRTLGKASKVTSSWKVLLSEPFDFVIWLSSEYWYEEATERQRLALMDHELTHCRFDIGTMSASMRSHDIEEFSSIWQRHGDWANELHEGGLKVSIREGMVLNDRGLLKAIEVGDSKKKSDELDF